MENNNFLQTTNLASIPKAAKTPRMSDSEFNRLRGAYDANKSAAMEAVGTTLEQYGLGIPLGVLTHLFDAAMAVPKLFTDPQEFSKELDRYKMGPLTGQLIKGLTETGPVALAKDSAEKTMSRTAENSKKYSEERIRRANAAQQKIAGMIDPVSFINNLRNNVK